MTSRIARLVGSAACVAGLVIAAPAHAGAVGASGTFAQDDAVAILSFSTLASGTVTIETFGYGGGTDATGRVVAAGGFDPVFALFTGAGQLLGYGDDGATRLDPVSGAAFDAVLTINLVAGDYFVAVSQFDNFAVGPTFAAGFLEAGRPAYTGAFGCSAGRFCDINGFNRTGAFDLSVSGNAVVAAVPEPGTFGLLGLGLACLGVAQRWRRRRS